MLHKQKIILYKLRIGYKCARHCVHDGEHVLLDCLSPDLSELRTKHQHLFSAPEHWIHRDKKTLSCIRVFVLLGINSQTITCIKDACALFLSHH